MTTVAVVSTDLTLAARVACWIARDYQVLYHPSAEAAVLVLVSDGRERQDRAWLQLMRCLAPDRWVIVTGDQDEAPAWVRRAERDQRVVSLFPAAPAALQVTVRSLLQRRHPAGVASGCPH
ncbi:MAG: hypothetical protein K6U89_06670 [Chloroflexi bacterium]|nr:hypothetical protein [Chloroflexota bacterium]